MQAILEDRQQLNALFETAMFRRKAAPNEYSPRWAIEVIHPEVIGEIEEITEEEGSVLIKIRFGYIRFVRRIQ